MPIDYGKKGYKIAVIALILALIGWSLPGEVSTNQTLGLNIVVNNTNLAPTIEPSSPGTGERVNNSTYWTNNSDIEIHVFAHAMNISEIASTFLYINDTLVSPRSGRPLGGAETAYRGVDTIIPRGSYYRVLFGNYHHYEWREYQILSGNITSNFSGTGTCTDCINISQLNTNLSLKVNKSGDTWSGAMIMDGTTITTNTVSDKDAYFYMESGLPTVRMRVRNTGSSGYFELFPLSADIVIPGRTYNFTSSSLDMNKSNMTNITYMNMTTGGINALITSGAMGIYTYVGNSSVSNCVSGNIVADFPGFFPTGIWSVARCNFNNTWELGRNGTQRGYAMGFVPDTLSGGYVGRGFRVQTFNPNSTSYYDFFQTYENNTRIIKGNLTVEESTKEVQIASLAGVGNAYVCVRANGTLYRGSPGC